MTDEELTIEEIGKKLESTGYISNNEISTSVFLSLSLNKPILIEGPSGFNVMKELPLNRL